MDRSEQLATFKRLRLGEGATTSRFEDEAEYLMAYWGLADAQEAVAYLKQAVDALPNKHAKVLNARFGFTHADKGLERRRLAYGEQVGRSRATVVRAENAGLEVLLDYLPTEPEVYRYDYSVEALQNENTES